MPEIFCFFFCSLESPLSKKETNDVQTNITFAGGGDFIKRRKGKTRILSAQKRMWTSEYVDTKKKE